MNNECVDRTSLLYFLAEIKQLFKKTDAALVGWALAAFSQRDYDSLSHNMKIDTLVERAAFKHFKQFLQEIPIEESHIIGAANLVQKYF